MTQANFETQKSSGNIAFHHAVAPLGDPTHLVGTPIPDTGDPAEVIKAQNLAAKCSQQTGRFHSARILKSGEGVIAPTPDGPEAQIHFDDAEGHEMWAPTPRRK